MTVSVATSEPKFLSRFENLWSALRRFQAEQGVCWTLLAAGVGLALLVVADYVWEWSWTTRATGLAVAAAVALGVFWRGVVLPWRWWTRPRTAVEIESRFPQLGQRIRTVVQYAGLSDDLIESEGVTPSLVNALEYDTEV